MKTPTTWLVVHREGHMQRRDVLKTIGLASVALPSSGCATLLNLLRQVLQEPTVEITKMTLKDVSLTSITSQFVAKITNPNPFGFALDGLDYALSIGGARFASGNAPGGVKLKAEGSATTTFDVAFDLGKTASAILDLLNKKVVDYTIDTTFHFKAPKPAPQQSFAIPTSFSGSMPMPVVPQIEIKSFDVRNISLSGVTFRVLSAVKNTNDFPIPIDQLGFDVKLGGRRVLSNKTVDGMNLGANKSSNVPVDFEVGLSALGLTALEIAQHPKLRWEVVSKLSSGKLAVPFTAKGDVKLVE
jgi:LEA14-like dessication related protein